MARRPLLLAGMLVWAAWSHGSPLSAQSAADAAQSPQSPQGTAAAAMGGVNTGSPHAAILDSQNRPITAGGTVKSGPMIFADATVQSGLSTWRHRMGNPEKNYILETVGSGVGLIDYDRDGWLDIYLVNGSTYEAEAGKAPAPHAALFHNNHDGTFTNVTARAGVANDRWGFGVAVADYDNDGWPDMFVSNFGSNRLYHNNHDGTFSDVAASAGVALGNWSTGATWGDYDGDGLLDLFVPGYVHYDLAHPPGGDNGKAASGFCAFRGVRVMCGPRGLVGEPDHLFHNDGGGKFSDVSVKLGIADEKSLYYGLASLFLDVNNDGKVDLLVADDSTPNYLYLNNGKGGFVDASFASGYALNDDGRETASMGLPRVISGTKALSISSIRRFLMTTSRFIATTGARTLLTSAETRDLRSRLCPFWAGERLSSTTTTTDGSICWRPTAMCIPRSTNFPGVPLTGNARCSSTTRRASWRLLRPWREADLPPWESGAGLPMAICSTTAKWMQ